MTGLHDPIKQKPASITESDSPKHAVRSLHAPVKPAWQIPAAFHRRKAKYQNITREGSDDETRRQTRRQTRVETCPSACTSVEPAFTCNLQAVEPVFMGYFQSILAGIHGRFIWNFTVESQGEFAWKPPWIAQGIRRGISLFRTGIFFLFLRNGLLLILLRDLLEGG